jgi:hypothetical protein
VAEKIIRDICAMKSISIRPHEDINRGGSGTVTVRRSFEASIYQGVDRLAI